MHIYLKCIFAHKFISYIKRLPTFDKYIYPKNTNIAVKYNTQSIVVLVLYFYTMFLASYDRYKVPKMCGTNPIIVSRIC